MHLPLLLSTIGLALAAPYTSCPGGYRNGEKIKEGSFMKKCNVNSNSYSIVIIGCLTSKGTEVPLGTKVEENKLVFNCIATSGGGARIETTPAGSSTGGSTGGKKEDMKCSDKYTNGQKFTEGSFVKQCSSSPLSWAIKIVACLTPSGKEIAIGSKADEGRLTYSCVETPKGAQIETDVTVKGCENGKYQKGQSYLSANKRFLLKCVDDYGSNDILACMTDEEKEVKVGSELIVGAYKYKCVKDSNGSVKYQKEAVGGTRPAKKSGCGQYAVGESILSTDGKFKFTCVSDNKIEFSACIVVGGEVKADTKKTIGKITYDCKSTPNGGASVSRSYMPE